jgi:hypothetical protein
MITGNLPWDSKLGYNLVEHKKCCILTIVFNSRNGLFPFSEVVHDHDNMLIPTSRRWVAVHKIHPPLVQGTDGDDWVKREWM